CGRIAAVCVCCDGPNAECMAQFTRRPQPPGGADEQRGEKEFWQMMEHGEVGADRGDSGSSWETREKQQLPRRDGPASVRRAAHANSSLKMTTRGLSAARAD